MRWHNSLLAAIDEAACCRVSPASQATGQAAAPWWWPGGSRHPSAQSSGATRCRLPAHTLHWRHPRCKELSISLREGHGVAAGRWGMHDRSVPMFPMAQCPNASRLLGYLPNSYICLDYRPLRCHMSRHTEENSVVHRGQMRHASGPRCGTRQQLKTFENWLACFKLPLSHGMSQVKAWHGSGSPSPFGSVPATRLPSVWGTVGRCLGGFLSNTPSA